MKGATDDVLDGRRNPVDRVAARVIKGGEQWGKAANGTEVCSPLPLPMMLPPQFAEIAGMLGTRFGYLTVKGFSADRPKSWVCRCLCGRYTLRKAKAIKNPANNRDCCARDRKSVV